MQKRLKVKQELKEIQLFLIVTIQSPLPHQRERVRVRATAVKQPIEVDCTVFPHLPCAYPLASGYRYAGEQHAARIPCCAPSPPADAGEGEKPLSELV